MLIWSQALQLVSDRAKLPPGTYFGECSGVAVDKDDNVWVFNRGRVPVMGKASRLLERCAGQVFTWHQDRSRRQRLGGRSRQQLLMQIGNAGGTPGTNNSKDAFSRPTGLAFLPNGDFFVSDGYENSRVVKFNRDGEYVMQIGGTRGKGPGEFDIAHDVAVDEKGRIYVADRENYRVQIFDPAGTLVATWKNVGSPWGLAYSEREGMLYICRVTTTKSSM